MSFLIIMVIPQSNESKSFVLIKLIINLFCSFKAFLGSFVS